MRTCRCDFKGRRHGERDGSDLQQYESNQKERNDDWITGGSCRRGPPSYQLKDSQKENDSLRESKKLRGRSPKSQDGHSDGQEEEARFNEVAHGVAQNHDSHAAPYLESVFQESAASEIISECELPLPFEPYIPKP